MVPLKPSAAAVPVPVVGAGAGLTAAVLLLNVQLVISVARAGVQPMSTAAPARTRVKREERVCMGIPLRAKGLAP